MKRAILLVVVAALVLATPASALVSNARYHTGAMTVTSGAACTPTSCGSGLTAPLDPQISFCLWTVELNPVRYLSETPVANPTTGGVGAPIPVGGNVVLQGFRNCSNFRVIADGADAKVQGFFFRP